MYVRLRGEDASRSSWWPTPERWDKGGYNEGFWSWRDELWFRERLARIRNNEVSLRNSIQWKSNVRGDTEWVETRRNLDNLARHCIAALYGTD